MTRREHVPAFVGGARRVIDGQDPGRGLLLEPLSRVALEDTRLLRELGGRHRAGAFERPIEPEGIAEVDGQDLRHPEARREQPLHELVALLVRIDHRPLPSSVGEAPDTRRSPCVTVKRRGDRRQRPLEGEEPALPGRATGVSADVATGAEHPVARHHDRDRVGAEGVADRARSARPADALRQGAVGRRPPEGDPGGRRQDVSRDPAHQPPVELQLETGPFALEVLIELTPDLIGRGGVLQDPGRELTREPPEQLVPLLLLERHVGEAARGDREEQLSDGALEDAEGDVEQPLLGGDPGDVRGRRLRPAVGLLLPRKHSQVFSRIHFISSLSFFTPWYTFARAASSEIPSASATSA